MHRHLLEKLKTTCASSHKRILLLRDMEPIRGIRLGPKIVTFVLVMLPRF